MIEAYSSTQSSNFPAFFILLSSKLIQSIDSYSEVFLKLGRLQYVNDIDRRDSWVVITLDP